MLTRRHILMLSAFITSKSFAQSKRFTDKTIKIVVPFAAGGGVDVYARLLAEKLRQLYDYTIIIENRAGANGTIGGAAVLSAEPDGTTLLFSAGTQVMSKHVMKSVNYDPIKDFASIAKVGEAPMLLIMSPNQPATNVKEMLAEAKKAPEKWAFATSSFGAPGHLATVAFNQQTGLNLLITPYRGTAPGLNDVAGGHIQLMIDPVLALLPMATTGNVKGLMVTTPKRTKLAPNIPSSAEAGLTDFDHSSWYGVWGPKAMSPALVDTINAQFNSAVQELDKEGRLEKIGIEPVTGTPAEFLKFATDYAAKNGALLKSVNFELQ